MYIDNCIYGLFNIWYVSLNLKSLYAIYEKQIAPDVFHKLF